MAESETYDAVVIGSGQAAGPLATALVTSGRKTALIEREHIGGTCINEGCTPTKTMVASAEVAHTARRAAEYGVTVGGPISVDMATVRDRKRKIVEQFRTGSLEAIQAGGVDVIMGEASLASPHEVNVRLLEGGERRLNSPLIVLNTGRRPSIPPIPGLTDAPYLTSTTIMELDHVPKHLLVIGGSYVGLEFAQMFCRFGSKVSIFEAGPAFLPAEDDDICEAVGDLLLEDGIDLSVGVRILGVEVEGSGEITLEIQSGEERHTVSGSHVLVAAGRTPNSERLNLPAAGVKTNEKGYIETDERLETNVAGIYAAGDVVAGNLAFTHISYDDFRILRANLIYGQNRTRTDRLIPYTVFIDPQLGHVGLTEKEAQKRGIAHAVASMAMSRVARADEVGRPQGLMKAVVDPESKQILGCTVLGMEGGEIMAMIEIAMMSKLPYTALRDGIFAHPTLAESLNNLFSTLD